MNNSNFIQTGGYPLNAERLKEQQTAYAIFNSLGALAGNLTIISGCTLTGSFISDGVVFINGEVIDFREATVTEDSTVIIIEEEVKRPFKNGNIKTVNFIRYATFGTAETSWLWSDFERVDPIVLMMKKIATLEKKSAVFQSGGGMVLWNKQANQIPVGWQEVVDWRGRMPVGFDSTQTEFNTMGKAEGGKTKTLSVNELPKHSFYMFSNDTVDSGVAITSNNSPVKEGYNGGGDGNQNYRIRSNNNTPTVGKTNTVGNDKEFSILNPYRVVMFIEYIG